jgi:antitoxin component HigA of HigAB toxin-antitoxin module
MAVRKAVKAGRIKRENDGLFDLEACRSAWGGTTDPARSKVREPANQGARTPAVRTEADAQAAVALIRRVLEAEGADAGQIDFNAARTADTILKAYQRDLAMAQKRKELVPSALMQKHASDAITALRQIWQRSPSRHGAAMAAELGISATDLDRVWSRAIAADLEEMSKVTIKGSI